MLLSEILLKKSYLEDKISELKRHLVHLSSNDFKGKSESYNQTLKVLFDSIDILRSYKIVIDEHNSKTTIKVGSSEVLLATAVKLMEALETKLEVMTDVINSGDLNINLLDFINQRSELMEEYLLLVKAIKMSDWNNEVE